MCPNAQIIRNGIYQCIKCKANNDNCAFVRYCPTKRSVENTDMAQYCIANPNRKEYPYKK